MIPAPFRSMRALRVLNVLGVGFALASLTAILLGRFESDPARLGMSAFVTGAPTLLVGTAWAVLMRWRKTVGGSRLRWGWLLSVPLAALNGAIAASILLSDGAFRPDAMVFGLFLGATFGAMVWVPALVATLVLFGVPIAWSQALAARGLAGEERGERVVGLAVALLSSVALALAGRHLATPLPANGWMPPWQVALSATGSWAMAAMAGLGLASGLASMAIAAGRERRRRRFVDDAEAGLVVGYRVDASPAGKVLVRVTTAGEGYRGAEVDEDVFALDEQGEAKRALVPEGQRFS